MLSQWRLSKCKETYLFPLIWRQPLEKLWNAAVPICSIKDSIWIVFGYFNTQAIEQPWFSYGFELLSAKELPWRTCVLRLFSFLKILKGKDVHDFLSLIGWRLQLPGLEPLVKSNFNFCWGLLACWTDFILLICGDSKTKLLEAIFTAPTKGTLYKNMT